jgi:predicted TIM-barrel fold metal-dependent hydrolase
MTRDLWSGPIVDAHQHFWDPIANDHPWLRPDVVIPFRYGDYSAIKRRYLPADYVADAIGHRVGTVCTSTCRRPGGIWTKR